MDSTATLLDLLPAYRRYLSSIGYSVGTILRYTQEASCFSDYAERKGRIWPHTVRATDLECWQKALIDSEHYGMSTVVTRMRGLRAFFRYLSDTGVLQRDPFVGFPVPRLPRSLPRDVLTLSEVMRLLRFPSPDSLTVTRDILMLEVLYATGLRVSELCSLNSTDLDLARRLVHVRLGKGGKDRVVPMGRGTATKLGVLLAERSSTPWPYRERPVFVSCRGRRLTSGAVHAVLRREAARCSIATHVSPHTLRHTCATHMLARGAGIFHVRDMLGHSDVSTTQIYTRVAPRDAQRTHRDKHPRERVARQLRRRGCHLAVSSLPGASPAPTVAPHRSGRAAPAGCPSNARRGYGDLPRSGHTDDATVQWITAYADHLRMLNRNERTVRAHVARLFVFMDFAVARGVGSCLSVSRQLILDYREQLACIVERRRGVRGAAVRNQFLAVVLCFYRFLAYREAIAADPGIGVRYAREPHTLPRGVPSPTDMAKILGEPDIDTPAGLRDRAILELLYSCGLRREELISLSLSAVNIEERRLNVWAGKGGKDRVVPIGAMAAHFVRQYIVLVRRRFLDDGASHESLFLGMRGRTLSKNSLLSIVQKHAASAGFGAMGITPHSFRHAFATHLVQNGADLRHVQDMMGHAKTSSTQIYVHLAVPDLKKAHHRCHPLG